MSGIEALPAIALVGNIMQIIGVGQKTILLAKRVYLDGTLDGALSENASILRDIVTQIESKLVPSATTSAPEDQLLRTVVKKCQDAAGDLLKEVQYIVKGAAKGSRMAALKVAVKKTWRQEQLDKLDKDFGDAKMLLLTTLQGRTCEEVLAMQPKIELMEEHQRVLLQNCQDGMRDASSLIQGESSQTRTHITAEAAKTESAIRQHVTQEITLSGRCVYRDVSNDISSLKTEAASEAKRERLLRSLKYEGMNERRSQVAESFSKTFDWILEPENANSQNALTDSLSQQCNFYGDLNGAGHRASSGDSSTSGSVANTHFDAGFVPGHCSEVAWDCFINWLKSEGVVYWISGKPGSGKSTLVKHIISHPRTKSTLDIWHANTVIVSHFFWRPGTSMQQSVRGMLSSLLYQLFQGQPNLLDESLSAVEGMALKDASSDWSLEELYATFELVLQCCHKPLCIFLDGVDEVFPHDEIARLFELIRHLIQLRPGCIKICLSSRPELSIQQQLINCPQLKLEQLTIADLNKYANAHLKCPPGVQLTTAEHIWVREIISFLVHRAEGVFLWLCLAIKSLKRGLENGDNLEDLQYRINCLHGDLDGLYEDMWSRTNEDREIYRESAALFFKLVIACSAESPRIMASPCSFDMLLCSRDVNFYDNSRTWTEKELSALCEETEKRVQATCAGLLELVASDHEPRGLRARNGDQYKVLIPYANKEKVFTFIHRSAHEFLLNTIKGRQILGYNGTSDLELRGKLVQADMVACHLFDVPRDESGRPRVHWHSVDSFIESISWLEEHTGQPDPFRVNVQQQQLLLACQHLMDLGRLGPRPGSGIPRRFKERYWEILVYAANSTSAGVTRLVLNTVATRRPSQALKVQLLLAALNVRGTSGIYSSIPVLAGEDEEQYCQLTPALLAAGANPNWTSTRFWRDQRDIFVLETPFTAFLLQAIIEPRDSDPEMIWHYVKHKANLDAQLCFRIILGCTLAPSGFRFQNFELAQLTCPVESDFETVDYAVVIFDAEAAVEELRQYHEDTPEMNYEPQLELGPGGMRIVALVVKEPGATDRRGFLDRYKIVSEEDSEYILETGTPTNCGDWETQQEFTERCNEVFGRSPHGEGQLYDFLELLGFVTTRGYDGDEDVQNPWKPRA